MLHKISHDVLQHICIQYSEKLTDRVLDHGPDVSSKIEHRPILVSRKDLAECGYTYRGKGSGRVIRTLGECTIKTSCYNCKAQGLINPHQNLVLPV